MSKNCTSVSHDVLLPYGLMNAGYQARLRTDPVPLHWRMKPEAGLSRQAAWERWREQTLVRITEVLWPVYDHGERRWCGKAVEWMNDLTRADLALLLHLQHDPRGRRFEQRPDSPLRSADCPIHREWFGFEDDGAKDFGSQHNFYDRNIDPKLMAAMSTLFYRSITNKSGTVGLQFKSRLQRPRPYQCALFFDHLDFSFEQANSSMTPSMCSGHSLEGVIAVGTIMEAILADGTQFSEEAWLALEQYAVDIGDRRVMAGVHWPSDNLASWIIAMRLADSVFTNHEVKRHLWHAIEKRSFVYRSIVESENALYRPSIEELEKAAATPSLL